MRSASTDNTCCESVIVFGQNIRRARERKNLRICQLASLSGYDRLCLSRLEYGSQNIQYGSALDLAKALDTPFPPLFSRNYLNEQANNRFSYSGGYSEDDFLLVYTENIRRELQMRGINQTRIYINCGVPESVVSRIMKGKDKNPTIQTLCKMATVTNRDLNYLFSRTTNITEMEETT